MRVPCPKIYRPASRAGKHPAHSPLMPWVSKRKGEPRAPVLSHRRRNALNPDLPSVDGCRSYQHPEGFGCVRRRLPMHMPDARYFIAHMHPPPVSVKASHAVTRHKGHSSGRAGARSATTRRNACIAKSRQVTPVSLPRHSPSNLPSTTQSLHPRKSARPSPRPSSPCSLPRSRCKAGNVSRSPLGCASQPVPVSGNSGLMLVRA